VSAKYSVSFFPRQISAFRSGTAVKSDRITICSAGRSRIRSIMNTINRQTNQPGQRIHLIRELSSSVSSQPLAGAAAVTAHAVSIPSGTSWLVATLEGTPSVVTVRSSSATPFASLEPLFTKQHNPRLLITSLGNHRVRINGRVAPQFAVARERDVIQAGNGVPLHVTIHSTPPIGPVPPGQIGKECPVCRVAFTAGCRCYTCVCGATMHCEDDKTEDGLQCAQLRSTAGCPACKRPLIMIEGYSYLPEEDTGE